MIKEWDCPSVLANRVCGGIQRETLQEVFSFSKEMRKTVSFLSRYLCLNVIPCCHHLAIRLMINPHWRWQIIDRKRIWIPLKKNEVKLTFNILLVSHKQHNEGIWIFFKVCPLKWFIIIYLAAPGITCGLRTLSCGMWDLVPCPGIKSGPLALGE